jgi:hypothetical protein
MPIQTTWAIQSGYPKSGGNRRQHQDQDGIGRVEREVHGEALYPVCRWFAELKNRRRSWWMSYL